MPIRAHLLILLGCSAALVAVGRDKEPAYEGRSLSEWLYELDPHMMYPVNHPPPEVVAIRHMGTNALPLLLKWMVAKDPPIKRKPHLAECFNMTRSEQAAMALGILGETARPAIPELTRLALTTRDPERADRCVNALAYIGPESMPSFIKILANGKYRARFSALEWLPALHVDNTPAMAAMITCLTDKDENLGFRAAQTLSESSIPEPTLVPALTNALTTASPGGRARIYRCLCWLKTPAGAAVPAIRAGLSDPSADVRTNAVYAAQRIAPELLTNTPPR